MDFNMLFLLSSNDKSTKSVIIKALAANQGLTNVQLQRIIKKDFSKSVTYQAIRQALTELTEQNVLEKKDKVYAINPSWVTDILLAAEILDKAVLKKQKIKLVDKEITQITLKSL